MAATGTPTPNIGLRRAQGTDPASVDDINYNSAIIDTKLGAVGNSSVQDQIDTLNGKMTLLNVNNVNFKSQNSVNTFEIIRDTPSSTNPKLSVDFNQAGIRTYIDKGSGWEDKGTIPYSVGSRLVGKIYTGTFSDVPANDIDAFCLGLFSKAYSTVGIGGFIAKVDWASAATYLAEGVITSDTIGFFTIHTYINGYDNYMVCVSNNTVYKKAI